MATEEKWSANTYKEAAKKHFDACQFIKDGYGSSRCKSQLVSELYYLGGYVIECTLKFFILINQGEKDKEYTKEELGKDGVGIWTHELNKLITKALGCTDDFDISWNSLCERTKKWSEQVRYKKQLPNTEHSSVVDKFWDDVQTVYNKMRNNY